MRYPIVKITDITPQQIASICDHTYLNRSEAFKQSASNGISPINQRKINFQSFLDGTLALEARKPYAVCVRPEDVFTTKNYFMKNNAEDIVIASVVGFPDGSHYGTDFKIAETNLAINNGASEIDMVLNYDSLLKGNIGQAFTDVSGVVAAANDKGALVKLILETSELNFEQIKMACDLATKTGVDFVKTSTGFSSAGAKPEDLRIMRAYFDGGVKMSGGVNVDNVKSLLLAVSGISNDYLELNPLKVRIGESSLISNP